ncbi:MAG: hypothetical protein K8R69_09565 [Deltaproteobacteria bacterium]|nr:hypothetical protein [Deltaproteobacteria bacterium]
MQKLESQSEAFLTYDRLGQPKLLRRSGSFVNKAEEESVQKNTASFQNTPNQDAPPKHPTGTVRLFGSFDQFRSRLIPKTAST